MTNSLITAQVDYLIECVRDDASRGPWMSGRTEIVRDRLLKLIGRVLPDPDTVARLRRVLKLLDLDKAVPQDDAALMDVLFSVLGTIASTIERRAAVKPAAERVPSDSETDWLNNNDERGLI